LSILTQRTVSDMAKRLIELDNKHSHRLTQPMRAVGGAARPTRQKARVLSQAFNAVTSPPLFETAAADAIR
jgi:hypothetical protein